MALERGPDGEHLASLDISARAGERNAASPSIVDLAQCLIVLDGDQFKKPAGLSWLGSRHFEGVPMQTPVQIDFQGIDASAATREAIEQQVAQLEERCGRITSCRVVLKGPGERHRTGGLYEVNIRLALPDGHEVDITRTPSADERHSQLPFAINDAFKRARRRLQDQVRRMQGQVKHHEVGRSES